MKGDVIMVNKKPFGKLVKSGGMIKDFTLRTIDDKDVMMAKGNIVALPSNETFIYYMMTFQPGGEKAEMAKEGLNFANQLTAALVQNEVMRDGQPNPEGIARFTQAYSKKLSEQFAAEADAQKNAKPLEYKIVERNRGFGAGKAQIGSPKRGDTASPIMQSGVLIGMLRKDPASRGLLTNYTITLPDGTTVSEFSVSQPSGGPDMGGGPVTTMVKYRVLRNNKYYNDNVIGTEGAAIQKVVDTLVNEGNL
jgi:hypothetical protein